MAVRRPSVCLFCQARQSSIGRRKASTTARRRLEAAVASRSEQDDIFLLQRGQRGADVPRSEGQQARAHSDGLDSEQRRRQKENEELRARLLGFEALGQRRDLRLKVLRRLSNPWPQWNENNLPHGHGRRPAAKGPQPPEAGAAPIPHAVFRRRLREAEGHKTVRLILRAQLLRCELPRDVLRIVAVAMQNRKTARDLAALAEPITRSMYRCRNNVSDPEVLRTLKIITMRLEMAGLHYEAQILHVGLKFAARARSLPAMKWFLQLIRQRVGGMSSHVFRSVIAKFSIGCRGLGEIRNGRWRREQLMQVLKGFDDCADLPPEEQYHLGSFLVRDDWQYLHGWVAVLARCRDSDSVWREWELWRSCPAREEPRNLNGQAQGMTTRLRGDFWFVEQMSYSGDLQRAWMLLKETGLRFGLLKPRVKSRLLEGPEFATIWDKEVREAMVWKYDLEMSKIEKALGVVWQPSSTADYAEGMHVLISGQTQEESLEMLGAQDFGMENEYGFPYDDDGGADGTPIVESQDRALHDAEEEGAVRSRQRVYPNSGAGAVRAIEQDIVERRRLGTAHRTWAA